jgi:hypothetical protein
MEDMPIQNITTNAFAAALEQENKSGASDKSLLSPDDFGVHRDASFDMLPVTKQILDSMLPGQNATGNGSTVFNPNFSDPRVERILGIKQYKSKRPENSIETTRIEMVKLQNQVAMLSAMVANKPIPDPVKTEDEIKADKKGGMTRAELEAKTYQEVVQIAKSLAIDGLKGINKKECINKILALRER